MLNTTKFARLMCALLRIMLQQKSKERVGKLCIQDEKLASWAASAIGLAIPPGLRYEGLKASTALVMLGIPSTVIVAIDEVSRLVHFEVNWLCVVIGFLLAQTINARAFALGY